MTELRTHVCLIGAGPIGLEMAIALKAAGIDYVHLEKRQIAQTIWWYPPQTRFFSSADRIAIAGMPVPVASGESKATREEYLAYLRSVVEMHDLPIRTYTRVTRVEKQDETFLVSTQGTFDAVENRIRCDKVIFATGDMHEARRLGIPGEDLPHVSHYFHNAHPYFRQRLLVVGGRNSAVEAALKCHHAGARVTLAYRRDKLDADAIKYWLYPEISGLLKRGAIRGEFNAIPVEIRPGETLLERSGSRERFAVEADFVLLATGFAARMELLSDLGIALAGPHKRPTFDPDTMESNVPGAYVCGTATAGSQGDYSVFIETSHIHVRRILAHLTGAPAPLAPRAHERPES